VGNSEWWAGQSGSLEPMGRFLRRLRGAPNYLLLGRRRRRLANRYLAGSGLEIGALHRPLPTPARAHVRYVDRMDSVALRSHYRELANSQLVEVDVVDDGETLATQPDGSADFIIANHFIEHTEDPLGTLGNHLRVLRPGGILYLAVPDRRHTFDADREPTPLAHLERDHDEGPGWSRAIHQEEWARLVDRVPPEDVEERVRALEREDYSIHFHAWAPEEFAAVLRHARDERRLPFEIEALQPNHHEFIAVLRKL
jgi:SAM-dependent methyltransferase